MKLSHSKDLVPRVRNENTGRKWEKYMYEIGSISSAFIWRRLAASVCSKYLTTCRLVKSSKFFPESRLQSLRDGRLTCKLCEGSAVGGPRPCLHKRLTHEFAWVMGPYQLDVGKTRIFPGCLVECCACKRPITMLS